MSLGAAAVGAAFSPINPFQVGIAQQLAQIPLLSGSLFRMAFLALAVAAWIWGTMRHARRARAEPGAGADERPDPLGRRQITVLLLVLATFVVLVWGVLRHHWGFDEMSALFFAMGDRKSTRLNSSHGYISYAVFCLKKKKHKEQRHRRWIISRATVSH